MKRDWEVIRKILLKTEELNSGSLRASDFEYASEITSYHVKLLKEAGLIEASIIEFSCDIHPHFDLFNLTWTGHEFLDSIRDDGIWEKTKSTILNKSSSMTFDLIKSVAIEFIKSLVTT